MPVPLLSKACILKLGSSVVHEDHQSESSSPAALESLQDKFDQLEVSI